MLSNFKDFFRREGLLKPGAFFKLMFIVTGIASTVWFLIRVIPKPSRATYPCMRTAAPIMSSFVIYLLTLSGSAIAFRKSGRLLANKKFVAAFSLVLVGIGSFFFSQGIISEDSKAALLDRSEIIANNPIGVPYGINPGRVVWVYDPDATNKNMKNKSGDYWWHDKNTDMVTVEKMLADGVKKIADGKTVKEAWDALFMFHDTKLNRAKKGYSKGDKIFIKLNLTTSWQTDKGSGELMDNSPHLALTLIKQLVNQVGVQQSDITIGDPFRRFRDIYYNKIKPDFPEVTFLDNIGGSGRTKTSLTSSKVFHTSDGRFSAKIPKAYEEAKYFINMSCLKSHDAAGITVAAKNHQGSVMSSGGSIERNLMTGDLHYCYPTSKGGYQSMGNYRHLVDYMGHKYMGGNTVLNIVDAIWSGRRAMAIVEKWHMAPFNNDYTSSLFLSQDRVAIEAVCYDFLLEEYDKYSSMHGDDDYPLIEAVPDYMEQAADPSKWAFGIEYDPEDDGTYLQSMGTYEHWNNSKDKQYTRNLGIDNGIHLVSVPESLVKSLPVSVDKISADNVLLSCSPNPAVTFVDIHYTLEHDGDVQIDIYSLEGKIVKSIKPGFQGIGEYSETWNIFSNSSPISPGMYICHFKLTHNQEQLVQTTKLLIK